MTFDEFVMLLKSYRLAKRIISFIDSRRSRSGMAGLFSRERLVLRLSCSSNADLFLFVWVGHRAYLAFSSSRFSSSTWSIQVGSWPFTLFNRGWAPLPVGLSLAFCPLLSQQMILANPLHFVQSSASSTIQRFNLVESTLRSNVDSIHTLLQPIITTQSFPYHPLQYHIHVHHCHQLLLLDHALLDVIMSIHNLPRRPPLPIPPPNPGLGSILLAGHGSVGSVVVGTSWEETSPKKRTGLSGEGSMRRRRGQGEKVIVTIVSDEEDDHNRGILVKMR